MTTPRRTATPRTLLSKERGEIAAFLRGHDVDRDRITELLDYAELHGSAVSLLDGVRLELTGDSWLGDLFAPRTEAA